MSGDPGFSPSDSPFRGGDPAEGGEWFDAIWEWDLRSGELAWARGLEERFGYDDPDVDPDLGWWRERVHPDDRERVEAELTSRLESARSWEAEFRFRRADGEYVDVYLRAAIVRSDDEPERLIGTMVDLDERRRARRALRELNERYRTIVEQNLVGISLVSDGEFVHVNPRLAEIHGYEREELLEADPTELMPEGPPDEVLSGVYRLMDGEVDEATVSGPVRRKDGETAHIESYVTRIDYRGDEAFLTVTVDVTDQVEAERAREASQRRFRAVFENARDGIVIADDDGAYVDANPAACELFGVERGSIVGNSIDEVDEVDVDFEGARGLFSEAGEDRGRFTLVRPDGDRRVVEYAATADILPDRHLAVLRDVTDRERQEAALEDERARLDFLNAMLRHHVLNGMNIVLATADHLAADAEGTRLERLTTIRDRGQAIVNLVQTIRSLVRTIRTGEGRGFEPVDLGATLQRSVEAVRANHDAATVTLAGPAGDGTDDPLPIDADLHVRADAMLQSVFDELVENAIVHGGAEPTVAVDVEADEGTVTVHVADEGPGIPETVREDLFGGRGSSGIGGSSGGSGFGLNVVHLLVTLYDGSMRIREREPRGSVVSVTFPRAYPDEE